MCLIDSIFLEEDYQKRKISYGSAKKPLHRPFCFLPQTLRRVAHERGAKVRERKKVRTLRCGRKKDDFMPTCRGESQSNHFLKLIFGNGRGEGLHLRETAGAENSRRGVETRKKSAKTLIAESGTLAGCYIGSCI